MLGMPPNEQDKQRELKQLWFVPEMYFHMAQSEKERVSQELLQCTVGELASRCISPQGIEQNQNLICAGAHLMSCAVRLFSIEECVESKRYKEYQKIREWGDDSEIKKEIETYLNKYIHFLLRHMVAHSESKRSMFPKYKTAYETMYKVYWSLDFNSIFNSMESARETLTRELNLT
jgi:hypothetical protein